MTTSHRKRCATNGMITGAERPNAGSWAVPHPMNAMWDNLVDQDRSGFAGGYRRPYPLQQLLGPFGDVRRTVAELFVDFRSWRGGAKAFQANHVSMATDILP